MRVQLKNLESGESIGGLIAIVSKADWPTKRGGWQFNWKKLGKTKGADFFKLTTLTEPDVVEGMLMLTLMNSEMLYMNNVEVAPTNLGRNGKFENVAGCLLAFSCYKCFELGKNEYLGYLSFESKTELMELYETKYGATHAVGRKMFFDPNAAKVLVEKFLKTKLPSNEAS